MELFAQGHHRLGLDCALFVACLLAGPIAANASGLEPDLSQGNWSVKAPHDLAHNPPSKDAVSKLVGLSPDNPWGGKVCDFHFADLRHQGTLSLVVSDDGGEKANCNNVEILDKGPRGIEDYGLDAGWAYLDGVEDINGDGGFEVIAEGQEGIEHVGNEYGPGQDPYCNMCLSCTEYWPRVYAWTGNGYAEVSSHYPKYYERELLSLKKQITAIYAAQSEAHRPAPASTPIQSTSGSGFVASGSFGGGNGSELTQPQVRPEQVATPLPTPAAEEQPDLSDLDCLKAEAAKVERFLGTSKDAGMSDAIEWVNSNDPAQRDFATGVLSAIGTAEALRYEKTLSRDSDRHVADSAKSEVESWGSPDESTAFKLQPRP